MTKYLIPYLLCLLLMGVACTRPGYSPKERSAGEKHFRANCRSCHVLPKPTEFTDTEWPEFLDSHSDNAELTEKETGELLSFLVEKN